MYSLTINFGATGTAWAFLFKEKDEAHKQFDTAMLLHRDGKSFAVTDDFGQYGSMSNINGVVLEDLEQVEAARIYRSLAEERLKVKLMEAARADPTIRAAMNQQRPPVLTPMGGGFRA